MENLDTKTRNRLKKQLREFRFQGGAQNSYTKQLIAKREAKAKEVVLLFFPFYYFMSNCCTF